LGQPARILGSNCTAINCRVCPAEGKGVAIPGEVAILFAISCCETQS